MIQALETAPVGLPFRRPYLTATGALRRREMLIVRIRSGDGTCGYGDAVPMSLRGGPGLDAVRSDLERICAPALVDLDLDLELGRDPLVAVRDAIGVCRRAGAGRQAISGVEIALLDLVGKLHGMAVWQLLGATDPDPITCNGTIGADHPEAAATTAGDLVAAGFGTLKVKVGDGADRDRLHAVRASCGPAIMLRIDANGAWSAGAAIEHLEGLSSLGLELAEQPCASVDELIEVRAMSEVPIVADESVDDLDDAVEALGRGAIDAATLKLAKVGGVTAALEIGVAAASYLSSALDSALGIAAAAHAAGALEPRGFAVGLAHGLATSALFTDNVADDAWLRGPSIVLGAEPGLGVAVDEDAIERLRI